ncbi:hypothetical protein [Phytomonospora endophytica]|uniref:Uncharacterized protein n=1 Tax=Phytomonospora endophytica TaxID=714109 RepID=A0A841FAP8_9ACTN|nr:hypothetical protein [Phytomonospora endophytica]MBB6032834.1 hypothetical protein [Phytomonospora endophytica]GIG65060.1 hypothetical protein Pen01_13550 [Phytomonospora endophytica]
MTTASPPSQPIPSEQNAYARADEHIGEAIVALSDPVRLEPGIRNAIAYDAGGMGTGELSNVEVSYTLEDLRDDEIPSARNERYFAVLKEFWTQRGYVLVSDTAEGDDPQPPGFRAVHVEHPADRCHLSLKQGGQYNLWITASMTALTAKAE